MIPRYPNGKPNWEPSDKWRVFRSSGNFTPLRWRVEAPGPVSESQFRLGQDFATNKEAIIYADHMARQASK